MRSGAKLLPGTGRGTSPWLVEGAHVCAGLAPLAPLHRTSCGPPPRSGEDYSRVLRLQSSGKARFPTVDWR
jgi:hypothetical protein